MKKIIGTNMGVFYAQKRLILHDYKDYEVKRKWDLYRVISGIERRLFKTFKITTKLHSSFGFFKPDAFHFFNAVSNTKRPWITTMESEFNSFKTPIFDPFDYLQRDEYKYILPYSNWEKNRQLSMIQDLDLRNIIEKKMRVVPVPQELFVEKSKKINKNTTIKFILVGNSFFRKGGYEILKIFEILEKEGYKFHLTIISTIDRRSYPIVIGDEKYNYALDQIKNKSYISHYSNMNNNDVLNIIKESHVGLLLSNLENYGYFLLECQACGVPVVSTNQRAFSEMNNDEIGWVISLKLNDLLIAEIDTEDKREEVSITIFEKGLLLIKKILDNPEDVEVKGDMAILNIVNNHAIDVYKNTITSIYKEIV